MNLLLFGFYLSLVTQFLSIMSMRPFMCGLSMLSSVLCVVAILSIIWRVIYGYILVIVLARGVLGLLIYICALRHRNFEVLFGSKFVFVVLSWGLAFMFYETRRSIGVFCSSSIYYGSNLYSFGVLILFLCILLLSILVLVQMNRPSRKA